MNYMRYFQRNVLLTFLLLCVLVSSISCFFGNLFGSSSSENAALQGQGHEEEESSSSARHFGKLSLHHSVMKASTAVANKIGELDEDNNLSASASLDGLKALDEKDKSEEKSKDKDASKEKQEGKEKGPQVLDTDSKTVTQADGTVVTTTTTKYSDETITTVVVTTTPDGITTVKHSSQIDPAVVRRKRRQVAVETLLPGESFDKNCRAYLTEVLPMNYDLGQSLVALQESIMTHWDASYDEKKIFQNSFTAGIPLLFNLLNIMKVFPWAELRDPLVVEMKVYYDAFTLELNGGKSPVDPPPLFNFKVIPDYREFSFTAFDEVNCLFSSISEIIAHYDIELFQFASYIAAVHASLGEEQQGEKAIIVTVLKAAERVKHQYAEFTRWLTEYMDFYLRKLDHGWDVPIVPARQATVKQENVNKVLREFFNSRKLSYMFSYATLDAIFEPVKSIVTVQAINVKLPGRSRTGRDLSAEAPDNQTAADFATSETPSEDSAEAASKSASTETSATDSTTAESDAHVSSFSFVLLAAGLSLLF